MGYWGEVAKRAAKTALQDARLNTTSVVSGFVVQGVIAAILFVVTGFTEATLMQRVLTALVPLLTFPVAFTVRMITEPAAMAVDDRAKIAALEDAAKNDPVSHTLEMTLSATNQHVPGQLHAVVTLKNVGTTPIQAGVTEVVAIAADGEEGPTQHCSEALLRVGQAGFYHFDLDVAPTPGLTGSARFRVITSFGRAGLKPSRSLTRTFEMNYRMDGQRPRWVTGILKEEERPLVS